MPANTSISCAIDESILQATFGNDPAIFKEILTSFLDPSFEIISNLRCAHEQHSAEGIKQAAHQLRSAAFTIGANDLGEACRALETAAADENWQLIDSSRSKLEVLMNWVEEYISEL